MRTAYLWVGVLGIAAIAGCAVSPGAGERAPDFTASVASGQEVSLADLMGPRGVVLYFYPKDETPGCIDQACTFQGRLADFEKNGYSVVGVSLDTEASHETFKSKYNLTYTLISDADKKIATLYNVPLATDPHGTKGLKRTTFVIQKDGTIVSRFDVADPKKQVEMALDTTIVTY
ncbi:MAG: peroxiredoxin [Planctomycetes bacterium]|nr:peroxiredoxin [Planctomycetota bacterium]